MEYLTFILFWFVVLGTITGAVAKSRGHEPALWFLFGGALFILALPLVLLLPPPNAARNTPRKTCPYCSTALEHGQMKCPACKRTQPNTGAATVSSWEKTVTTEDEVEKWARENSQGK